MKIEKYRTAGWSCEEYNCGEAEDEFPGNADGIERMRDRAKYHHTKTGHEVHFVVSTISEYKKEGE